MARETSATCLAQVQFPLHGGDLPEVRHDTDDSLI